MALDFAPPRYAQLVTAIQERISTGAYEAGSLMPTEAQLADEFGVSRATVVRALQLLKADGWVESRQGRGTFVRSAPAPAARPGERGRLLLDGPEVSGGRRKVGTAMADAVQVEQARPPRAVASALGLPDDGVAVLRRRVVTVDGEPSELVSAWFPIDVAEGTDLGSPTPLAEGALAHLARRRRLRLAEVSQRITARMPTADEARTLSIPRRVPVLDLLVTGRDANDRVIQAVTIVLPADRHQLEDHFPV